VLTLTSASSAELDRIRRFRKRIEYGATRFSREQVAADLVHARAIVDEVERSLVVDPG